MISIIALQGQQRVAKGQWPFFFSKYGFTRGATTLVFQGVPALVSRGGLTRRGDVAKGGMDVDFLV